MVLTSPVPPEELLDALRKQLRSLSRTQGSLVPSKRLTIARGLAVHQAGRTSSAEDREIGWRFVVTHGEGAFWIDMLGLDDAAVFQGPAVEAMLRAADVLEAADLEGEVCVLVSPLVAGGALWVRGQSDVCVQFSPEASDTVRERGVVTGEWQAMAADLARQSAGLIE